MESEYILLYIFTHFLCLPAYLINNLPFHLITYLHMLLHISTTMCILSVSIYPKTPLYLYIFIYSCLIMHLLTYLFFYISVTLFISGSIYLPVSPLTCLPPYLSICIYVQVCDDELT